jgi:Zn-dependent protease with chaperone function
MESKGKILSNVERILSTARTDVRLQTIINNYFQKIGYAQHLVCGLSFKEGKDDSPAFCLGFQIFNIPMGLIFVSEGLSSGLTQEEMEFVVLHEMGHIMKSHFVGSSFVWLMKSWIIDIMADSLEVSKQKAREYLDLLKAFYVLLSGKKTVEEEAKAKHELEADNFAITVQGRKDPSISTLLKLSKGNIRAPTHVTFDGRFPFPVITYEERIDAVRRGF